MAGLFPTTFCLLQHLRSGALKIELRILQGLGISQPPAPVVALPTPVAAPWAERTVSDPDEVPSFLDSIFWMAAPKSRRSIEVNRTRRRAPSKLIKLKTNIVSCTECGHLKQKHVLCGFCYEKVLRETAAIKEQIRMKEGGHFNVAIVETAVLYEGESPTERDEGKRIIERNRKRPSWFTLN